MALGALAVIPVAWTYVLRDYQKDRILSFLNPTHRHAGRRAGRCSSPRSPSGSGGLLGTGLTNGTQTRGEFLPVQESDFVFAVLAQELGFIGALVVFVLYGALLWRILACAWSSRDPFGLLFGAGLASMLLFQLFVNVGMVIGLMPVTGIPLPFISNGGASLVTLAIGPGHRPEHQHPPAPPRRVVTPAALRVRGRAWPVALALAAALGALAQPVLASSVARRTAAAQRPGAGAEETMSALYGLFILLLGAKVGEEVLRRLGQPGVVGELLGGFLVGPYALGLVTPGETALVFSEIGVVVLLFTVGLEVRTDDLFSVGRPAILTADHRHGPADHRRAW